MYNYLKAFAALIAVAICFHTRAQTTNWTVNDAIQLARDFNTPSTWDTATFNMEVSYAEVLVEYDVPLRLTPFPTPTYNSPGNGAGYFNIHIDGINLSGHTLTIARGEHSEHLFSDQEASEVHYFTLLTIADSATQEDPIIASSRNHPNYVGQGRLNPGDRTQIDWVAMQTADGQAYAIVNGRLFDLRAGRVVIASPQPDSSVLFYQTNAGVLGQPEWSAYLEGLDEDLIAAEFLRGMENQ